MKLLIILAMLISGLAYANIELTPELITKIEVNSAKNLANFELCKSHSSFLGISNQRIIQYPRLVYNDASLKLGVHYNQVKLKELSDNLVTAAKFNFEENPAEFASTINRICNKLSVRVKKGVP